MINFNKIVFGLTPDECLIFKNGDVMVFINIDFFTVRYYIQPTAWYAMHDNTDNA